MDLTKISFSVFTISVHKVYRAKIAFISVDMTGYSRYLAWITGLIKSQASFTQGYGNTRNLQNM
jgi:hypothetical protein